MDLFGLDQDRLSVGEIPTYKDGQFALGAELKLNLAAIDESAALGAQNFFPDRNVIEKLSNINNIEKEKKIMTDPTADAAVNLKYKNATQDDWRARKSTKSLAIGTVYGREASFGLTEVKHSQLGINAQALTTDGNYSAAMITKVLREVAVDINMRHERINELFNQLFLGSNYENYVSLFTKALMLIAKRQAYDNNSRSEIKLVIQFVSFSEVPNMETFTHHVHGRTDGFGFRFDDPTLTSFVAELARSWSEWKRVTRASGAAPPPPDVIDSITLQGQVWTADGYDDGHYVIDKKIALEDHGFVQGRFWVGKHNFKNLYDADSPVIRKVWQLPSDDAALRTMSKVQHFFNCSGFSPEMMSVFDFVLRASRRDTPFMADQVIDFDLKASSVWCFYGEEPTTDVVDVTVDKLMQFIKLTVMNHRVHEDLLAASRIAVWWSAQPATETFESAWWRHVVRRQQLPQLGMRRALLPFLTAGEASGITADGIAQVSTLASLVRCLQVPGVMLNTYWYWGEYLALMLQKDYGALVGAVESSYSPAIQIFERAYTLVSALTGRQLPVPFVPRCAPYFAISPTEQLSIKLKYSRIDDNFKSSGHVVDPVARTVSFHHLITPACTMIVVGLAGTLIRGSPLSSAFALKPKTTIQLGYSYRDAVDYYDLWALAVVSRWQGFDVLYESPFDGGEVRTYAANDVSVALPPIARALRGRPSSVVVKGIMERKRCFGAQARLLADKEYTFTWTRGPIHVQQTIDYNSLPITEGWPERFVAQELTVRVDSTLKSYQIAVVGSYDVAGQHFQTSVVRPGILPTADLGKQKSVIQREEPQAGEESPQSQD